MRAKTPPDIREMFQQPKRPELTMEDWYIGAERHIKL
jgi:hypothetical protein